MKKVLPLLVLLVMGAMLMISWSNVSDTKTESAEKYKTLMAQAERFEEKKIYVDAAKQYASALAIKPEYNLAMRTAGLYKELSNDSGYIKSLETAISCEPDNPEPYFMLIESYKQRGQTEKLYSTLNRTKQAMAESEKCSDEQRQEIEAMLKDLLGEITIYAFDYDEAYGFHRYPKADTGYIMVRKGNTYGLLKDDLTSYMECKYDGLGFPNSELIPLYKNNEYYYIDTSGNRKVVPDSPATMIGTFGGGYAPVQIDGKYGYIDAKMKEYHFEYEYAGSFENGIAPVKQNGKWFVINTKFAAIGPNFDEILIDAYGFCSPFGVYFGRSGNTWGMYSAKGEKLADGFEEVKQFASSQPAAVKKDGKWGFVSLSGEVDMEPQYEEVGSYSIGYAPVKIDSRWGFMDREGKIIVDPQFISLGSFSPTGNAIGDRGDGLCSIRIKQYK